MIHENDDYICPCEVSHVYHIYVYIYTMYSWVDLMQCKLLNARQPFLNEQTISKNNSSLTIIKFSCVLTEFKCIMLHSRFGYVNLRGYAGSLNTQFWIIYIYCCLFLYIKSFVNLISQRKLITLFVVHAFCFGFICLCVSFAMIRVRQEKVRSW